MTHKHKLQVKKHQFFLEQNRKDPITGDSIQENDTIVICAVCKSAFLEESWNYIGRQHCNQFSTLKTIPREDALVVRPKKIKYKRAKKVVNHERNETLRSIFILLAIVVPMGFYVYCMMNYIKPDDTTLLFIGAFLTAGICGVAILFIEDIFKDKMPD
ncbi:hypothetical protein [Bernardetia sp.]|uniref:hypothetical protein n=1 Tax=Bernardetia sp. TaxID=1937974 RepID=UPI0025B848C8|nr:hypothetical protein [Bernardetia sp.]